MIRREETRGKSGIVKNDYNNTSIEDEGMDKRMSEAGEGFKRIITQEGLAENLDCL